MRNPQNQTQKGLAVRCCTDSDGALIVRGIKPDFRRLASFIATRQRAIDQFVTFELSRRGTGACQARRHLRSQAISQCVLTIALKSAPKPCRYDRNERAHRSPHHEVCQQAFLSLRKPKRGAAYRPRKTLPNHPSPIRPTLPTSRRNHPRYNLPTGTGSHKP
jgi:hypothetical protein